MTCWTMSPRCSGGIRVCGDEATVTSMGASDAAVTVVTAGGPVTAAVLLLRIEYWLLVSCETHPARTVSVTVPRPPAATLPMVQRTRPPVTVGLPVADTNNEPEGNVSSTITPSAVCVPVFV